MFKPNCNTNTLKTKNTTQDASNSEAFSDVTKDEFSGKSSSHRKVGICTPGPAKPSMAKLAAMRAVRPPSAIWGTSAIAMPKAPSTMSAQANKLHLRAP
mmetsp:Transcript_98034/g.184306  ORF Transcript_98034/g.184306 Transcript_98034/m.184306 type:complete len:99 (+) Transcript_98034:961-1257(+)